MDLTHLTEACQSMPGAEAQLPFGPDTLVFKVKGKMFALLSLTGDLRINLKCAPEKAVELRERHENIEEGYHMNKRHWISIYPERGNLPSGAVEEWIGESYQLVCARLTATQRAELAAGPAV